MRISPSYHATRADTLTVPGAGLTVASRLSENAKLRILVIEAGLDQRNNSIVTDPAKFAVTLSFPRVN